MIGALVIVHLMVCVALVAVVLLQAGKGGGLAGAFGAGGGGQALFGGRGAATFLSKATVVLGAIFFVSSLSLAFLATKTRGTAHSLVQEAAKRSAPAGAPPAQRPTLPSGGGTPGGGTQGGQGTPSGGTPGGSAPSGSTPSGSAPANPNPAPAPGKP